MIGRAIWFALLAALALLTGFLQLDMRSRSAPHLAAMVPEPLRSQAQMQIARQALAGPDAGRALAEARKLVQRRPLPAEPLTILALAQLKAGQTEAGLRTIQIAGQRGWRDPVAQEAMLRLALANGDRAEAARRYGALFLRRGTPNDTLVQLGPGVLEGPDETGRATLVAIIVGSERWQPLFLRRGAQVMPPAAFADIAERSLRRGARFECGDLRSSMKLLGQRDAVSSERLAAAVAGRCPDVVPAGPRRL